MSFGIPTVNAIQAATSDEKEDPQDENKDAQTNDKKQDPKLKVGVEDIEEEDAA